MNSVGQTEGRHRFDGAPIFMKGGTTLLAL